MFQGVRSPRAIEAPEVRTIRSLTRLLETLLRIEESRAGRREGMRLHNLNPTRDIANLCARRGRWNFI